MPDKLTEKQLYQLDSVWLKKHETKFKCARGLTSKQIVARYKLNQIRTKSK